MRILIAHNSYRQRGGEDIAFEAEAKLLRNRGHTVTCYTLHNDRAAAMGRVPLALSTLWNRQVAVDIGVRIQRDKPDVVHLHNTFPLMSPSAAATARHAGIPVVQTLHNYRLVCPSAQFYRSEQICHECAGRLLPWPGIAHRCYRESLSASAVVALSIVEQRVLRRWDRAADLFVTLTEEARRCFVSSGLPADRLVVKPNFLDHDPGIGRGDGGYAIFVGRLSPEKGILTLLDAWSRLSEPVVLKIVGSGPLDQMVVDAAQADSRIEFLGWRDRSEVLSLLKAAAMLVFPSQWYEGLPLTIIEALAVGTPVIASRLGAMNEVIDDGETGYLFNPADAVDLAGRITYAREQRLEHATIRCNARKAFEATFTADQNYQQLLAIYARARERRPARREVQSSSNALEVK